MTVSKRDLAGNTGKAEKFCWSSRRNDKTRYVSRRKRNKRAIHKIRISTDTGAKACICKNILLQSWVSYVVTYKNYALV